MDRLINPWRRWWLYALTAILVLFLIVPVLIIIPMSFSASRYLDFPPTAFSLQWYDRLFGPGDWWPALMISLKLAALTALITAPLGVAVSYAVHHAQWRFIKRLETVMLLPLMVPHIIVAVGIFYGYVHFKLLGSFWALLAANVMLALPFVVVSTSAGLRTFDDTQELVARIMGCSRLRAFLTVTLPQIRGSVITGMLFAFVSSLDEVVVAILVSTGRNVTVTKVMFDSLRDEIDPTIAAVSTLMIVLSFVGLGLALWVQHISARRAGQRA